MNYFLLSNFKIHTNICVALKSYVYSLDVVFCSVEARGSDWRSALEMAKVYCDVSQPETLRNASKSLLSVCETKLKEANDEVQ